MKAFDEKYLNHLWDLYVKAGRPELGKFIFGEQFQGKAAQLETICNVLTGWRNYGLIQDYQQCQSMSS